MTKSAPPYDVLVFGNHCSAYFAAFLLRQKGPLRVGHCALPDEHDPDRLSSVNPKLFSLHAALEPLKKKVDGSPVFGVEFVADDGTTRSEYRSKTAIAQVVSTHAMRDAMKALAEKAGVDFFRPKQPPAIESVDETGLVVAAWSTGSKSSSGVTRVKSLLVAGPLSPAARRALGIDHGTTSESGRRYTFARLPSDAAVVTDPKPIITMSLDLGGNLRWAWLFRGKDSLQLAVETPADCSDGTQQLLHWADVLQRHGVLKSAEIAKKEIKSVDLSFAGALDREGVANRTLLIGPEGGFSSATGEDLYPNCWSAVFAVETITKALKEPYLQDALQPHRQRWGATLGDYLRGPQQNLRFLMPMVYRNPVMTERMCESILLGKPVVR